jgi:ribosomal protein L16 Arg81 hydroxylase
MEDMGVKTVCAKFIQEVQSSTFFEQFYGKQLWHLKGEPDKYTDLLNAEDLKTIITFSAQNPKTPRMVFQGFPIDLKKLYKGDLIDYPKISRMHKGGATLIYNWIDHFNNRLFYLTKSLEYLFEARVHANLYATPALMRGFNAHSDEHDVLVIQLSGSKKWSFYKANDKPVKIGTSYKPEEITLTESFELSAGDTLYVPKGLIHSAESTDETSRHLTLGITGYTWAEAIKEAIDQYFPSSTELQEHVPIHTGDQSLLSERAHEILAKLRDGLDFEKGISSFKEENRAQRQGLEDIRVISRKALAAIDEYTSFQLNSQHNLIFDKSEEHVSANLDYRRLALTLPLSTLPAIEIMKLRKSFTATDLTCFEDIGQGVLFLRHLWSNDIIIPAEQIE